MSDHEKLNDNQSTFKQKHETQSPTHASGTASESVNPAAAVQRLLGGNASHNDVIQLQRTIGNRAVTNMVQRSAYNVTPGNDGYEFDAENKGAEIASVMAGGGPQRKVDEEGTAQLKRIQRTPEEEPAQLKRIQRTTPEVGFQGGGISEELTQKIDSAKGKGDSVDPGIQSAASEVLQRDFSSTKVQVNPEITKPLMAEAATIGDTVFVSNASQAKDPKLMGHELTHSGVHQGAAPIMAKRIQRNTDEEMPQVEDDSAQLKRIQRNVDLEDDGKEFE